MRNSAIYPFSKVSFKTVRIFPCAFSAQHIHRASKQGHICFTLQNWFSRFIHIYSYIPPVLFLQVISLHIVSARVPWYILHKTVLLSRSLVILFIYVIDFFSLYFENWNLIKYNFPLAENEIQTYNVYWLVLYTIL